MLKDLYEGLLDLLYPPSCVICQQSSSPRPPKDGVCPDCASFLTYNVPPFCLTCSRHLPWEYIYPRCSSCLLREPEFDFAWAACSYTGPAQLLVKRFKYQQKTQLRRPMCDLMAGFIRRHELDIAQFDQIVPVPLSPTRLRERGYNQAELLAAGVASLFNVPLSVRNLVRLRHTQSQVFLPQKERWTNISGAFTISFPNKIKGRNVLLVDDLLTTGATASEASKALKHAGARRVGVLTFAIAAEI